jgi:formylglycine-generating enzyme required for sulfatase activity
VTPWKAFAGVRTCARFLVLGLMLATCAEWAQAARLALVIGNDAYRHIHPLKKAVGDATTMASELAAAGFAVVNEQRYRRDLDRRGMYGQLEVLKTRISPGDEVVVFFSGHGVQVGASSYLLPVDFPYPANEQTVLDDGIALQRFMDDVKAAGARFSLFIIDACRNNNLPRADTKSIGLSRGINQQPSAGQMVLFAAGKDQTALDRLSENDPHPNGVFTRVLVKHLRRTDVPVIALFADVQEEVEKLALTYVDPDTKRPHQQLPAFYNETRLKEPFCFHTRQGCPRLAGLSTETASATVRVQSAEEVEQEYWNGIRESRDTRDFEQYLKLYPSGRFVALARQKLKVPDSSGTGTAATTPAPVALPQRPPVASEPAPPTKPPYAPPSVSRDCPECPEMVVIPAGSFEMGSPAGEAGRWDDEGPVHRVRIGRAFELGKTEVTQGQWKAVMGTSPSAYSQCGDTCPVEQVSWEDVQEYIRRLNARSGKVYRLPSEAEWEYACRAGRRDRYCGGANLDRVAWHVGNSGNKTHPVGQKAANAWGVHDMSGNVLEWVEDCYQNSYTGAPSDGSAWTEDTCVGRVLRGGSFSGEPQGARAANRFWYAPSGRSDAFGFRLARTLP